MQITMTVSSREGQLLFAPNTYNDLQLLEEELGHTAPVRELDPDGGPDLHFWNARGIQDIMEEIAIDPEVELVIQSVLRPL